jgi:hypothetical protein
MKTAMKLHESQLGIPTLSMGNHFVMQGDDLESMRLLDFENAWAGHQCKFRALLGRDPPIGLSGCRELHDLMEQLQVPYSCACHAMNVGISTNRTLISLVYREPLNANLKDAVMSQH